MDQFDLTFDDAEFINSGRYVWRGSLPECVGVAYDGDTVLVECVGSTWRWKIYDAEDGEGSVAYENVIGFPTCDPLNISFSNATRFITISAA